MASTGLQTALGGRTAVRPSMLSSKVVKPGFASSSSKVVTPRGNVSVKVWPAPANEDDPQKKTEIGKRRGELARAGFRTVYDHKNWEKHRNTFRLIDRLVQLPQSQIMQNIVPSVAWIASISALVTAYMYAYDSHILPDGAPSINPALGCQAFIQNTSVALSLLLVFRTNASYGRWDEARKMWGLLLNRSRDILRQGCTLIPDHDEAGKQALARWTIAFAQTMRMHFQPEEPSLDVALKDVLRPEEIDMLMQAKHRPVKAAHALSQIIQDCDMHPIHQQQMSGNVTQFQDILGGCERLLRAPIPLSYTRHTARFLFVWLTLLPFALYSSCGVWTTPVAVGVAAVLCGIEEVGMQCEEPFGILPLAVIADRIKLDVMQTLEEDKECKSVLREAMFRKPKPAQAMPAASAAATAERAAVAVGARRLVPSDSL